MAHNSSALSRSFSYSLMLRTTATFLPFLSLRKRRFLGMQISQLSLCCRGKESNRNDSGSKDLELTTYNLKLFFVGGGSHLQDGEEGLLRDVDLADALHAALAFFLLFEEFAFAGNVSAVALGENVFADGRDGFARDDAAADSGLDRHFKHLARNEFSQKRHQIAPAFSRKLTMNDQRQRVDRFAGDQHI